MKLVIYFVIFNCLVSVYYSQNAFNKRPLPRSSSVLKAPKPAKLDPISIINKMCKYYNNEKNNYTVDLGPLIGDPLIITPEPDCHKVEALVVGGVEAQPKQLPHVAAIGYGDLEREIEWECTGNLISEQFILSAAHCKSTAKGKSAKWARLGDLDLDNDTNDTYAKNFQIIATFLHDDYNPKMRYNDILLFKLYPRVEFNAHMRPICLPNSITTDIIDQKATIAGFGYHNEGEARDYRLRRATLELFSPSTCEQLYPPEKDPELPRGFDSETALCAGDINSTRDTCKGDSGGPLQIDQGESCVYRLIGITSFGPDKCTGGEGLPGVYTNVIHYISWIQGIVWPVESFNRSYSNSAYQLR